MRRGGHFHVAWWVWVVLMMAALAAAAVGVGWFLVVMVLMAWLAVTIFHRVAPAQSRHRAGSAPQPRELLAQPRTRLDAVLRDAPSGALCWLWEQTGADLRRTYLPSTVCSYAALREAILDELSRRHPDGVQRWLDDQPDRRELSGYLQRHP